MNNDKKTVYISVTQKNGREAPLRVDLNKIPERLSNDTVQTYSEKIKNEIISVVNENNLDTIDYITKKLLLIITRSVIKKLQKREQFYNPLTESDEQELYEEYLDIHTQSFEKSVKGRNYSSSEYNEYMDNKFSYPGDQDKNQEPIFKGVKAGSLEENKLLIADLGIDPFDKDDE